MSYVTLDIVKEHLRTGEYANDDTILQDFIDAAQAILEQETHRRFVATSETRYYNALEDVREYGTVLRLDEDLTSLTTLTNGDGEAISSGDVSYYPRNDPPYFALKLKEGMFTYSSSPVDAIAVEGLWGLAEELPADCKQAIIDLAIHMYRRKDTAQDYDRPLVSSVDGVLFMPPEVPRSVQRFVKVRRKVAK